MFRADRFRTLRDAHGYTHSEMADLLAISVRQIARYENNETDPSGNTVSRMAQVFGVSADYLLGLTDDPSSSVKVDNLTAMEKVVISAMRGGDVVRAIRAILDEKEKISA